MATSIVVIDVDLGISVEDIINNGIVEVTRQNRDAIAAAVQLAVEADAARQKVEVVRAAGDAKLQTIFNSLAVEGTVMTAEAILAIVAPDMANTISFVGRMRNWLKANKPGLKLSPCKRGGKTCYSIASEHISEHVKE